MFAFPSKLTRRAGLVALGAVVTAAGAGAATVHRMAVSQTTGSLGAQAVLQNSASGSAFQGEVGGSSANTSIKIPFGVLGEYDAAGSTFGIGTAGISTTGYGVAGEAFGTQPSMLALSGSGNLAFEAAVPSTSTANAVYVDAAGGGDAADLYADKNDGYGLYASASGYGNGAEGDSVDGDGVYGSSSTSSGVEGYSSDFDGVHASISNTHSALSGSNSVGYAVYANNGATATPAPTAAPYVGAAAYGQSSVGPGVYGVNLQCCAAVRYDSQRFAGVFGYGNSGPGVQGFSSNDFGVYAQNNAANNPTLFVENEAGVGSTGISIYAFNDQTDDITIAYSNGNFYTSGTITSGTDTYQAVSRNPGAGNMATYSAQHTEATVEDFGTAHLVGGSATVPLAADFRQTIDPNSQYMVFLTPDGDNHGLYIASRSPAGFVVRENQNGRSSLTFDYRIVAKPYGTPHPRLPHLVSPRERELAVAKKPAAHADALRGASPSLERVSHDAASRAASAARRARTRPPAIKPFAPLSFGR